jgi:hypothetical protein
MSLVKTSSDLRISPPNLPPTRTTQKDQQMTPLRKRRQMLELSHAMAHAHSKFNTRILQLRAEREALLHRLAAIASHLETLDCQLTGGERSRAGNAINGSAISVVAWSFASPRIAAGSSPYWLIAAPSERAPLVIVSLPRCR